MSIATRPLSRTKSVLPILFALGVIALIGTWVILYWTESLFTESHLVGYYCCVTEQDLPTHGTLERMLSDFFRTSPGMHLPSLIFVAVNAGFFIVHIRHAHRNYWWLPYLFIAFNILYLIVTVGLFGVSWSISDRMVGRQTSAYKGYDRTWYGIALHLMLWGGLFMTLSKVPKLLSSLRQSNDAVPPDEIHAFCKRLKARLDRTDHGND